MKKALIGCGFLIALLIAGSFGASYFVYHRVSSAVAGLGQLRAVPALEASVRAKGPYVPPASGEVSERQIARLLRVQQAVRARIGARGTELERKYHDLMQKREASVADMPQLVSAYSDLAGVYVDAKRVQADALNAEGLSLDEYHWIRKQAYAALGIPLADRDLAQMVEDIKAGKTPQTPMSAIPIGPSGPPATRQLVKPHEKALTDYMPYAYFGL
jgi:hypothetical protein